MTEKEVRDNVRKLFRQHDDVKDYRVLDRLLFTGEDHLSETLSQWKQKTHLHR